jgi:glycine cleavage system H lipoate-binding protein
MIHPIPRYGQQTAFTECVRGKAKKKASSCGKSYRGPTRAEDLTMTVILVLAIFVTFLAIERATGKKAPEFVLQTAPRAEAEARKASPIVAGYEIPEHLRFHQGHAWALGESPNLVRAGIDDFAAKLIGEAEEVNLPQRGQWIRQGQKVWSFRVNGELIEMVSPIEGTVSDVNDEVVRHPESLTADPYGDSWLMTVQSPDAKTNFRNLLSGNMARNLMGDSAKRLAAYIPEANLALAQDGGKVHGEIAKQLPAEKYVEITKEFFLA